MQLRRHAEMRRRHRGHADVVDEGRAALADVGALDQVAELAFGHADADVLEQGLEPGVAERRADAQPVDLLLGLDEAQAHVLGIELDDLEMRLELSLLARQQRPDQADALCPAPLELVDCLGDAAVLAPAHVAVARDFACEREMVVPLDMHHHAAAGLEHDIGLDGARPARDPLRRVAGAMVGDDEEMVDVVLLHDAREPLMAPRVLGAGKPRIFLSDDRAQPLREIYHPPWPPTSNRCSPMAKESSTAPPSRTGNFSSPMSSARCVSPGPPPLWCSGETTGMRRLPSPLSHSPSGSWSFLSRSSGERPPSWC